MYEDAWLISNWATLSWNVMPPTVVFSGVEYQVSASPADFTTGTCSSFPLQQTLISTTLSVVSLFFYYSQNFAFFYTNCFCACCVLLFDQLLVSISCKWKDSAFCHNCIYRWLKTSPPSDAKYSWDINNQQWLVVYCICPCCSDGSSCLYLLCSSVLF